ncbi:MAG: redoxin domain-containing protein [Sphingobacteriales bacterium]|jgi:peroxiredoxin|nr:MAG: redoxin domain-containing protein [Sphingobacteriales bacterium]
MKLIFNRNSEVFKIILFFAGIYGILWGISAIFFPKFWFSFAALNYPIYPELFQTIGLYEFALGFAYLLAYRNPIRNWQIVLIGFIIKVCMVVGFIYYYYANNEPQVIFRMVFINDFIWILPFLLILYNAYKHEELLDNELVYLQECADDNFLKYYTTNKGNNLSEISFQQPILLVFLRHFGCTFCKSTLNKIQVLQQNFSEHNVKIVLVNMLPENQAAKHLQDFDLYDLDYVSDEEAMLYKAFKLNRGKFKQLFGFKVFVKGISLWISEKLFISSSEGTDVFQMPGVFLIKDAIVVKQFKYDSVADEPPFLDFVNTVKTSTTNNC